MFLYIVFLSLNLLSTQLVAVEFTQPAENNKRTIIDKVMSNAYMLFDALLLELDDARILYNTTCQNARAEEERLKNQLMSLERENEQLQTIQAELNIAHKDLAKALENETNLKNKLTQLQEHAGKELSQIRNQFDSFKANLEVSNNNVNKIFW